MVSEYLNQFQTDVAEHLVDCDAGYARGPERALLIALLFDGIQSFINYATCSNEVASKQYREAYLWVMSEDREYPFSFESVCEAVGINPAYLRLGLINVYNSNAAGIKKHRRNF